MHICAARYYESSVAPRLSDQLIAMLNSGAHQSVGSPSRRTDLPYIAISTLLQPPIVRTGRLPHAAALASSAYKPLTALDIPPVTLTNIAHVDVAEFKPYLIKIGAFYERLRRVEGSENEAADKLYKRSGETDEFAATSNKEQLYTLRLFISTDRS
ncbi:Uncharacterized protein TCAP_02566 [Tolypocladium capitatum]|uniref:Uncharacterized protein n=1 Tax=Tolypocladium capitatum TaxID=45235 RepID=A0A2K3QJ22_9HYPO|nr:Uncharacterized protein TCAP_02566 [Tolypocladium capitatum]